MGHATAIRTDGGGRVLVADDEEGLRSLLTIRFEQQGIEVVTAADGQIALETLTSDGEEFDALLLDVGMPRMDGYELLEQLDDAHRPPLTIVLSGHDSEEDRTRALDLGADMYVVKPFSPADLAQTVREHL